MNQKKMRGVVDPYGLGFLIGIIGAFITLENNTELSEQELVDNEKVEIVAQKLTASDKLKDEEKE